MIPVSIIIDGVEYDAVLAPFGSTPNDNCTACLLSHFCSRRNALCSLARTEYSELVHYE